MSTGTALTVYEERSLTWEEQFEHVIAELCGGRSVSAILRDDEGMPTATAFWKRVYRDETADLYGQISRAREQGVEAVLEEARMIADTPLEAVELEESVGPKGVTRKRSIKEATAHRRLQIDTRIKYAQMIAPRYSERMNRMKQEHEQGQVEGERPSDQLDDVSRATRLAALAGRIEQRQAGGDE